MHVLYAEKLSKVEERWDHEFSVAFCHFDIWRYIFQNVFHLLFLDSGIIDLKMVMQHSGLMTYMIYVPEYRYRIQVQHAIFILPTVRLIIIEL